MMSIYLKQFIFLCTVILFANCQNKDKTAINKTGETDNKWVQLFNGKDLNDWVVKIKGHPAGDNYLNTFRVENGIIKVSYDQYEKFDESYGHLFYKNPFSSYQLKVQYRFTGIQKEGGAGWAERNSGLMIHSQSPESMDLQQNFPGTIEVQMLGGLNKEEPRPTGNLCTPGTNVVMDGTLVTQHCTNAYSDTFYGEQWVNLEVMVIRDSIITHKINGKEVLKYSKPQIGGDDLNEYPASWSDRKGELLKGGYISLQSESHPIEFRNIELLALDL